ncbi:MAG: hypothetical protein EOO88_41555, partial [Pedobacter sp.]
MKPRTKLQQTVYSLSQNLPEITPKQEAWAFKNCLDHIGYRSKTGITCLDCGTKFDGGPRIKTAKCPNCKIKLKVVATRKKKLDQRRISVVIVDVVEEFQLVRFFEIYSYHRSGYIAKRFIWEVCQQWFAPNEKLTIVARTCSFGNLGFSGDLEVRQNHSSYYSSNKYDLYADAIIPGGKCLPIYVRNGFTEKIGCVYPYSLFTKLLRDSKLETLLKSGQLHLASGKLGNHDGRIHRYWDS